MNVHLTGDLSPTTLINGIFLDDDWSPTGGAAENCALNDCQHDMYARVSPDCRCDAFHRPRCIAPRRVPLLHGAGADWGRAVPRAKVDAFLSHSWRGSPWQKSAAVLIQANFPFAVVVAVLVGPHSRRTAWRRA